MHMSEAEQRAAMRALFPSQCQRVDIILGQTPVTVHGDGSASPSLLIPIDFDPPVDRTPHNPANGRRSIITFAATGDTVSRQAFVNPLRQQALPAALFGVAKGSHPNDVYSGRAIDAVAVPRPVQPHHRLQASGKSNRGSGKQAKRAVQKGDSEISFVENPITAHSGVAPQRLADNQPKVSDNKLRRSIGTGKHPQEPPHMGSSTTKPAECTSRAPAVPLSSHAQTEADAELQAFDAELLHVSTQPRYLSEAARTSIVKLPDLVPPVNTYSLADKVVGLMQPSPDNKHANVVAQPHLAVSKRIVPRSSGTAVTQGLPEQQSATQLLATPVSNGLLPDSTLPDAGMPGGSSPQAPTSAWAKLSKYMRNQHKSPKTPQPALAAITTAVLTQHKALKVSESELTDIAPTPAWNKRLPSLQFIEQSDSTSSASPSWPSRNTGNPPAAGAPVAATVHSWFSVGKSFGHLMSSDSSKKATHLEPCKDIRLAFRAEEPSGLASPLAPDAPEPPTDPLDDIEGYLAFARLARNSIRPRKLSRAERSARTSSVQVIAGTKVISTPSRARSARISAKDASA
jgi:hypothetical protein